MRIFTRPYLELLRKGPMRKGDLAVTYGLLGIKVPALRKVVVVRERLELTSLRAKSAVKPVLRRGFSSQPAIVWCAGVETKNAPLIGGAGEKKYAGWDSNPGPIG